MKYQRVSSYAILAKVKRDFGINTSGWVGDAIEWIGEVLQELAHRDGFVLKSEEIEIKDNRGSLPCNFHSILAVEYNNQRLRLRTSVRPATKRFYRRTNETFDSIIQVVDLENHKPELQHIYSLPYDKEEYYQLSSFLETSFTTGTVTIYYNGFPLDENGFPLVPDIQVLRNACAWYILRQWLSNGNTHPIFNYDKADEKYEEQLRKTRGKVKYPTVDEREAFTSMWTRIIRNVNTYSNFDEGTQNPAYIENV